MNPSRTRGTLSILFLGFAFAVQAAAQDQDLIISSLKGPLVVSGSPVLAMKDATHLYTNNLDSPTPSLVLYDLTNNPTSSCVLQPNWIVQVGQSGGIAVTISQNLLVAGGNTFSNISAPSGYVAWQLNGYTPDSYFKVTDATNNPQCAALGNEYSKHFLRITTEPVNAKSPKVPTDPGDLPIPIIGSSLKFIAPGNSAFSCDSSSQATLDVGGKASLLEVTHSKFPDPRVEPYLNLKGISDWRITAYPQLLEVTPSYWGTKLKFTVPSGSKLKCGSDTNGNYLNVLNADGSDTARPQEFSVDWSPGWFGARHFLTVPCVNCYLLLVVKGN